MSEDKNPPKKFCSAPWSQGVLFMNQQLQTCCRNSTSFGNYKELGLKGAWLSPEAQKFREKIREGDFPDVECRSCYSNGTMGNLMRDVGKAFAFCLEAIISYSERLELKCIDIETLRDAKKILVSTEFNEEESRVIDVLRVTIDYLRSKQDREVELFPEMPLLKLENIVNCIEDFLKGSLQPRTIAPHRQIQLIAVCNARCFHCPGLYTGQIVKGQLIDGKYKKYMLPEEVEVALEYTDHITDFFTNGSEFLLHRQWKKIMTFLNDGGVKMALSTNGMLLTRENIDFLFSKDHLTTLNISIDGGTKETIEKIRVNVCYQDLISNLKYLFEVACKSTFYPNISFSFVLMKRNYTELPDLLRLIHLLRGPYGNLQVGLLIQSLERIDAIGYGNLLEEEHISNVEEELVRGVLMETEELAGRLNVQPYAFYSWPLSEFNAKQMPLPPRPVV